MPIKYVTLTPWSFFEAVIMTHKSQAYCQYFYCSAACLQQVKALLNDTLSSLTPDSALHPHNFTSRICIASSQYTKDLLYHSELGFWVLPRPWCLLTPESRCRSWGMHLLEEIFLSEVAIEDLDCAGRWRCSCRWHDSECWELYADNASASCFWD